MPAKKKRRKARRAKKVPAVEDPELLQPLKRPNLAKKAPDYVVQIGDPKLLRKDLLESLREIIIFMQGYEKFKRIQEEKIKLFSLMKKQKSELDRLIQVKLRSHIPRGKLTPMTEEIRPRRPAMPAPQPEMVQGVPGQAPPAAPVVVPDPQAPTAPPQPAPGQPPAQAPPSQPAQPMPAAPRQPSELDELEGQLKDIESQLKNIK